jgi:inner membrane transporter RhtA
VPPSVLVVTGIISVQLGAGLAGRMFGHVAPAGITGVRLWWAAVILAVVGGRGLVAAVRAIIANRAWRDAAVAVAFGVILGVMNYSIYQSFARIPLGVAVTIEFLGPLAVAVASSRRLLDGAWVAGAGAGVALLTLGGTGVARASASAASGVIFALVAAAAWAAYILLSRSTGRRFSGSSGLVIAMLVAAVVVTPAAVRDSGTTLLHPGVLLAGLGIGLLSSVIPYQLELEALRRVPARVFGIWMSLEPAVGALVGLVVLGEALAVRQWLAIACVTVACAGAARGGPREQPEQSEQPQQPRGGNRIPVRRSYDGLVPGQLTSPGSAAATLVPSSQSGVRRLADLVLDPSPAAMRRIALAGVAASAAIILTGAAVRLSQSGLGCPDWPQCTARSLGASGDSGSPLIHRWIEFGNRLVTVAIFIIAVVVSIAAWRFRPGPDRRRRRDLVWLAAAQPGAIVVQAGLGGIVVLTKLNPGWVSGHFRASAALVAAAVALYVRCQEGTAPARPLVRREVRLLAFGVVGAIALMLTAGTVVTGTGPLAGARSAPRYSLPLAGVTQLHADIGWLLGGLLVALVLALRLSAAPRRAVRLTWLLVALIGAQGAVGYAQYFSGLPAGLVWVHVTGATAIWVTVLLLPYALRDRGQIADRDGGEPGPPSPLPAVSAGGEPDRVSP